jgi:hypothetical protein
MRETSAELGRALDRLMQAGLLFRQGVPPHATYLFKHALVQDAASCTFIDKLLNYRDFLKWGTLYLGLYPILARLVAIIHGT